MRLLWTIAAAILLLAAPPGSVPPAEPLFIEAAAKTGLAFTHVNGASGRYYIAEQMGSGAALFDYDHDGWLDLFVANGAVNIVESLRGQPNPYRYEEPAVSEHRRQEVRRDDRRGGTGVRHR